jgi:hypothetical protein
VVGQSTRAMGSAGRSLPRRSQGTSSAADRARRRVRHRPPAFAGEGAHLLGRMQGVRDGKLTLAPDVEDGLSAGDAWVRPLPADDGGLCRIRRPGTSGRERAG